MKKDIETTFTGWSFMIAALLLVGGWLFSSHQVGEYFKSEDYRVIGKNLWYWIWVFRFHIFGWVILGAAMMAFIITTFNSPFNYKEKCHIKDGKLCEIHWNRFRPNL